MPSLPPELWAIIGFWGACVGSFLNVCVHRWPLDQSVVAPRSRCPGCHSLIRWYDNIPVLSYVLLRGRCRSCNERISARYPLVELSVSLMYVALVAHFGLQWSSLVAAVFFPILLAIALTDLEHYLIPDELSLGGLVFGLCLSLLPGGLTLTQSLIGAIVGFALLYTMAVVGEWAFKKPAMGGGDIKMMAMVGAFVGWPAVLITLFLGSLLGTLIMGPISLRTGKLIPFGIFLSAGAALSFLFGDWILDWYWNSYLG